MRKWYGWLFGGTALVIAGLLWLRNAAGIRAEITVWKAQTQTVIETVQCSGRLETADSQEVYVDYMCVAERVMVKKGDYVRAGDVLFTVDIEQTKQVLAAMAGLSVSMLPDTGIVQEVKAPISGKLEAFRVKEGKEVSAQEACAVIMKTDTLQVAVTIAEHQLRQVKVGQPVTVSGNAFARTAYTGTVTSIASVARQVYVGTVSTTVVDAVITLEEIDESLKPGLTTRAVIQVGRSADCLVVPYEYVLQDDSGQEYVYVLRDGYAVKQTVETGYEWSSGYAIEAGLTAGECVVREPEQLDGDRVRVRVAT